MMATSNSTVSEPVLISVQDENGNAVPAEKATAKQLRPELDRIRDLFEAQGGLVSTLVAERTQMYEEIDMYKEKVSDLHVEEETSGIDDIDWDDPLAFIESDYSFFPDADQCSLENVSNSEDPRKCLVAMENFQQTLKDNLHRFKHLPKGPLFKEIKVKDKRWAPLVEHILHPHLFSFLVDNDVDALVMEELLEIHFPGLKGGMVNKEGVVCPKHHIFNFTNQHEFASRITAISGIPLENLLESIYADDEDWSKFLSGLISIEKIILMENENSAFLAMSSMQNRPDYCKMAYTLDGFCVYPFPAFRTVKIKFPKRSLYLQCLPSDEILQLARKMMKIEEKISQKNHEIEEKRKLQMEYAMKFDKIRALYNQAKLRAKQKRLNKINKSKS